MKKHYQPPHYTTDRLQSRLESLQIWQTNMRLLRQIHRETQAKRKAMIRAYNQTFEPIGANN